MFNSLLSRIADANRHAIGLRSWLHFVLRRPGIIRFRWGSLPFVLRMQDRVAFNEIVKEGEYAFVSKLIPPTGKPRVLDIGANIGLFSLQVFQSNPAAQVVALEPAPDTFSVLDQTRRENASLNWQTRQEAVYGTDGFVEFDATGTSTGRAIRTASGHATIRVAAVRLETILDREFRAQSIDLLKLDVEGAEESVLRASSGSLQRVTALIIELHDSVDQAFCIDTIRRSFKHLYKVTGRSSAKPLLVASNREVKAPNLSPM